VARIRVPRGSVLRTRAPGLDLNLVQSRQREVWFDSDRAKASLPAGSGPGPIFGPLDETTSYRIEMNRLDDIRKG
jgi:hypothetical protein